MSFFLSVDTSLDFRLIIIEYSRHWEASKESLGWGELYLGRGKKATKIVLVCCVWKLSLSTQQTIIFWMMFIVLWLWKFNGRRSCCCSYSAVWTCLLMQWTLKMWNLGLSCLSALAESSKSFLFAGITSLVNYTTKQWRFRDISKKFIESMIILHFQRVFNHLFFLPSTSPPWRSLWSCS